MQNMRNEGNWSSADDRDQAYIHSRMRRRTADFLQGEPSHPDPLFLDTDIVQYSTVLGRRTRRKNGRRQVAGHSESKARSSFCSSSQDSHVLSHKCRAYKISDNHVLPPLFSFESQCVFVKTALGSALNLLLQSLLF